MKIVNLSACEVLKAINDNTPQKYNYRKDLYFGEDDTLGFYYKLFTDGGLDDGQYIDMFGNIREKYINRLNEYINVEKSIREGEYVWEYYTLVSRMALINRLEELKGLSKLKEPAITGLALYKGFPVGVLIPRLLTYYRSLCQINMDELSLQEKKIIFERAQLWVDELVKRNVYPVNIYSGNIVVNPEDYSDVVLDGLDEPAVVKIESKYYAKRLKSYGRDLKKESFDNLNKIKKLYLK